MSHALPGFARLVGPRPGGPAQPVPGAFAETSDSAAGAATASAPAHPLHIASQVGDQRRVFAWLSLGEIAAKGPTSGARPGSRPCEAATGPRAGPAMPHI